jgi:ABC-type branched-subunit amino acid transport system ATPase component
VPARPRSSLESGHLVAEGTPDLLRNEEHVRALYLGGA